MFVLHVMGRLHLANIRAFAALVKRTDIRSHFRFFNFTKMTSEQAFVRLAQTYHYKTRLKNINWTSEPFRIDVDE